MEMGTQTDEQPLPGSALQVFINRDAEALMALIFQASVTRSCTPLPPEERISIRDAAQKQTGCSVHVTPGVLSLDSPPPVVPICAGTMMCQVRGCRVPPKSSR